tara:strand:- start:15 stop:524 length:510 start_codon:yes stop_codon:yes gene_type:complete
MMKATLFALFVFSFSLLGAEPKVVGFDKLQKRWKAGSQLTYIPNQDTPFTGKAVDFHSNGQKWQERTYKDGKLDGPWNSWRENGQKAFEANWKDGKRDGLATDWYENGQKRREETYKDGKLMSAVGWKPNGEKCPVTNVKDGNGVLVWYNKDGTERFRYTYKDGERFRD